MWVHVGVSPGKHQERVATYPESDLQMKGLNCCDGFGGGKALLCLCLRSGAWATPHCPRPTGPWWVSRPSWRLPLACQVPTACKWLQSLARVLGSPAALSASY